MQEKSAASKLIGAFVVGGLIAVVAQGIMTVMAGIAPVPALFRLVAAGPIRPAPHPAGHAGRRSRDAGGQVPRAPR